MTTNSTAGLRIGSAHRRWVAVAAAGLIALVGCGSDESKSAATTATTTAVTTTAVTTTAPAANPSTTSPSTTTAPAGTEATVAPTIAGGSGVAAGTLTLVADGVTIDAEIVSCVESGETQVEITAEGETSTIRVVPAADNTVDVTSTGAFEFEGDGTAVVSDVGGVTITGEGSTTEPGSTAGPFTITAQLDGC